jgi:hypothetical protein
MLLSPTAKKTGAIIVSLTAWFALVLQLYLLIKNAPANGLTNLQATSRFFSYFTILTNLIVALSLTLVLAGNGGISLFFSRLSVQTAIAVYIFIVGLSYNILLRHLWKPQGLQLVADELLHVAVPLLYVLHWIFCVTKKPLPWKHLLAWLLYPFFYLVYILLRASFDGFYPYYFINVTELGYAGVLRNALGLMIAFVITSILFIAAARRMARKGK